MRLPTHSPEGTTNMLQTGQREYEFTLVLAGIDDVTSAVEDALLKAGCDDATLSMRSGRPYLSFARGGDSMKDAILSAIRAVLSAGIGADVLRVDQCDLVTQADIARKIGVSRQVVNNYIAGKRGPGAFPPPACNITDDAPLWNWCEVAHWLYQNDMIRKDVLCDAQQVSIINSALELRQHRASEPQLTDEIYQVLTAGHAGVDPSCCPG
jgi:hypothetical protein